MELTLSPMIEKMKSVCRELYDGSGAHDHTFTPIPLRGTERAVDAIAAFKFEGFDAAFIFNARVASVQNVLECRIDLHGGERYVEFSLYDLMYLLNENDFSCYLFPYIDSMERMELCLRIMFGAVMTYRDQLGGIGKDEALCARAKNHKKKEMLRFFKHDIFAEVREQNDPILAWRLRGYREWYISRFCSRWYSDYMNGNYERAARRLESYDSKCDYELRMHRFLKTLVAGATYTAAPTEANTFARGNGLKSARSRSAFVMAMLIGAASSFVGYTAIGYAAYFAIYHKALYCTSLFSGNIPVAAALCAVPTGFAAAQILWRRLLSRKEKTAMENAGIHPDDTGNTSRKSAVHTAVIIGIIVMMFAAKSGIAIYENGIVDNSSVFESRSLPYSSIQMVVYEKQTDLYHIYFEDRQVFTCTPHMANSYILPHIDTKIIETDKIEKES